MNTLEEKEDFQGEIADFQLYLEHDIPKQNSNISKITHTKQLVSKKMLGFFRGF
jgi:hypothetical protein